MVKPKIWYIVLAFQLNVFNFNCQGNEIPLRVDENNEVFMNATIMVESFRGKESITFAEIKKILAYVYAINDKIFIARISVINESSFFH